MSAYFQQLMEKPCLSTKGFSRTRAIYTTQ